jgi:hypothetical protein
MRAPFLLQKKSENLGEKIVAEYALFDFLPHIVLQK